MLAKINLLAKWQRDNEYADSICIHIAILHELATITLQSLTSFARTLREQIFKFKN
jgi:hypothetical protein